MSQAAPVLLAPTASRRRRPSRPTESRAELLELAASSGAVERFIEVMGGPPEFDGCDEDDIRAFIRENAP
jgi:hypothetical protein